MRYVFFFSLFMIIYHLFLYPLILAVITTFKKKEKLPTIGILPTITVICPAFNEQESIEKKIASFKNLEYPKDKIKLIIISDDSTDQTNELVRKHVDDGYIELLVQKPRGGKQNAHNLVLPLITSEYVLSTDANSIFDRNAVKELVKTMFSNDRVVMVSGELKLLKKDHRDSGEGIYWRCESCLKRLSSLFYSITCSNGSIYLIKKEFFTKIEPDSVDDFQRTLFVLDSGKLVKYNPNAVVYEFSTQETVAEIKRKMRIVTREWLAVKRYPKLLNFYSSPEISFLLWSHKILRWLIGFFSLFLIISNLFLMGNSIFFVFLLTQSVFYLYGLINIYLQKLKIYIPLGNISAYWISMNYVSIIAFFRFLLKRFDTTWDTVRINR